MDDSTSEQIIRSGIHFFKKSRHSRNHNDAYHTFDEWQQTPLILSEEENSDGTVLSPGLECSRPDSSLASEIVRALDKPGSYYAHGPEKVILVIPEKRIVVLSYNG